ncbi:hypothetical protein CgunFtcFv8_027589 [Champsocephalus gunnari]|uniref:Cadherin Y-type LIR-motif domain-containing protein n=1 Tax=Champsocephalus gunnari TaxID=52237 RepID=A0AAN8DZH1_CHAGU|nr:hypothetical protein CgunFtcFv8_027589 [Champsocephalus gunnari]
MPPPRPLPMEELLNIRLDQLTCDPSLPPFDSLQTYQFEGRDSRAESLSSLDSDGGNGGAVGEGGGRNGGAKPKVSEAGGNHPGERGRDGG